MDRSLAVAQSRYLQHRQKEQTWQVKGYKKTLWYGNILVIHVALKLRLDDRRGTGALKRLKGPAGI